jgi:hypothetical protein
MNPGGCSSDEQAIAEHLIGASRDRQPCPGWPFSGARVLQDSGTAADNCRIASRSPRDDGTSCQTILAATNKFLAKSNKSQTGVKATKKRRRISRDR